TVGVAGAAGLSIMAPVDTGHGDRVVRLVQPNIPQREKWRRDSAEKHLRHLLEMSRRPGFEHLAAVVWPETAVPFTVQPNSPILPVLATAVPPGGYLLAGAERTSAHLSDGAWNSLLAIDGSGAIRGHYD